MFYVSKLLLTQLFCYLLSVKAGFCSAAFNVQLLSRVISEERLGEFLVLGGNVFDPEEELWQNLCHLNGFGFTYRMSNVPKVCGSNDLNSR